MKLKHLLFLLVITFGVIIGPRVFALSSSGNATVGRSAVMDTSSNYYYTAWTSLSSNSLNVVPIPYSGGQYYQMGSEYVMAVTLNGETSCNGSVRVPVVSNTIYNYTLMNGLNDNDLKLGFNQNFGVYGNVDLTSWNMAWECQVYSHLGIAHNYCYYDATFSFILDQPLTGSYNFNFAVFNTTGNRSAWYYDGYDSNGNAIEFPVSASNSGYANLAPTVRLNCSSGSGSSSTDTEQIVDSITESTTELQETIQESYENLVKSQEVCNTLEINNSFITTEHCNLATTTGQPSCTTNSSNWNYSYGVTDFIPVSSITILRSNYNMPLCFYDSNKSLISCSNVQSYSSLPEGTVYLRTHMQLTYNVAFIEVNSCRNGNQAIYDFVSDGTIGDSIGSDFTTTKFIFFNENTLSGVITAPLDFIRSLNSTCTPPSFTVFNSTFTVPCGTTIFWNRQDVQTFRTFWNILFGGLIIYRLCYKLFLTVNDALDPTKDSIGGFDL